MSYFIGAVIGGVIVAITAIGLFGWWASKMFNW